MVSLSRSSPQQYSGQKQRIFPVARWPSCHALLLKVTPDCGLLLAVRVDAAFRLVPEVSVVSERSPVGYALATASANAAVSADDAVYATSATSGEGGGADGAFIASSAAAAAAALRPSTVSRVVPTDGRAARVVSRGIAGFFGSGLKAI